MAHMFGQSYTIRSIAKATKVTDATVVRTLHELGLRNIQKREKTNAQPTNPATAR